MSQTDANELVLTIDQTLQIQAPIETVYQGVVDKLRNLPGENEGDVVSLSLEAWPGGRWFRDLGEGRGHLWGFVQAIKPPTLIEICGPMFMSLAVAGNLQLRLTEEAGGTRVDFRHQVLGPVPEDYGASMKEGWKAFLHAVQTEVE